MKTDEEIKKGLEICQIKSEGMKLLVCDPDECPYGPQTLKCKSELHEDAYSYIQQIEAENERLQRYYEAEADRAADAHYNMLEAEESVPRWIPVEERLPEDFRKVLVRYTDDWVTIAFVHSDGWINVGGKKSWLSVTHWMPLPEPPEVTNH